MLAPLGRAVVVSRASHRSSRDVDHRTAPCLTQSIYVVLAEFDQVLIDRLAISGWKVVQGRVTTLRLWLQLWDAQTGRLLWESAGEATVASELLRPERTVPLHGIARKLWLRMIREGLLDRRSQ